MCKSPVWLGRLVRAPAHLCFPAWPAWIGSAPWLRAGSRPARSWFPFPLAGPRFRLGFQPVQKPVQLCKSPAPFPVLFGVLGSRSVWIYFRSWRSGSGPGRSGFLRWLRVGLKNRLRGPSGLRGGCSIVFGSWWDLWPQFSRPAVLACAWLRNEKARLSAGSRFGGLAPSGRVGVGFGECCHGSDSGSAWHGFGDAGAEGRLGCFP